MTKTKKTFKGKPSGQYLMEKPLYMPSTMHGNFVDIAQKINQGPISANDCCNRDRKPHSELKISFRDTSDSDTKKYIRIEYSRPLDDVHAVGKDFVTYLFKVLETLGTSDPNHQLLNSEMKKILCDRQSKSTNIIKYGSKEFEFRNTLPNATWDCSAGFFESGLPISRFGLGKEGYYASISCIAFLQYLINTLGDRTYS